MNRLAIIALLACLLAERVFASAPWKPPAVPGVAFEQQLGARLPMEEVFRDETGARTTLSDALGGNPAVVFFGYSRCPQLCSVVANGTVEALRGVSATAGRDFSVTFLSIDPAETARDLAAMKHRDVQRYGRTGVESGWHYLAGEESAIRRVTEAAGFRFTFDPRQKLYAHASGFLVVTPDGRVARYFLGVDFRGEEIAAALTRARDGKIGEPVFALLLACARGLGVSGKYGALIWSALGVSVAVTVTAVFGGIGWMLWQERRGAREGSP